MRPLSDLGTVRPWHTARHWLLRGWLKGSEGEEDMLDGNRSVYIVHISKLKQHVTRKSPFLAFSLYVHSTNDYIYVQGFGWSH